MESSLLSRKPSSQALPSGRSVSGDQLGMELVGARNLLHGFAATTKPTSEENPEGNDGEKSNSLSKDKTTYESSSSFSEPIFYDFLGLLENDQVLHQVGEAQGHDESDASLELKLYLDPWAIKKMIQESDLGNSSRLLLWKRNVEEHILPLWDAGRIESIHNAVGVGVAVWDFDTQSEHQLIFKKRPSNGSYVLIGKWNKEFVTRRGLKKGDEIGLYWDQTNSRFNFTILKSQGQGGAIRAMRALQLPDK